MNKTDEHSCLDVQFDIDLDDLIGCQNLDIVTKFHGTIPKNASKSLATALGCRGKSRAFFLSARWRWKFASLVGVDILFTMGLIDMPLFLRMKPIRQMSGSKRSVLETSLALQLFHSK